MGRVGQLVVRPASILHLDCIQGGEACSSVGTDLACRTGGQGALPGAGATPTVTTPGGGWSAPARGTLTTGSASSTPRWRTAGSTGVRPGWG